jgi:UDP-3-O-[3-hydroxymyristoyl] glucosamine N-acyltransferase
VGVAGHLVIANNTSIGAKAGIGKSIAKEGEKLMGAPSFDVKEYYRAYAVFKQLPDLSTRLRELEAKLQSLDGSSVSAINGK